MAKPRMMLLPLAGICVSWILVTPCAAGAPPDIHVNDLGTLGGRFTVVTDVNDKGDATGYSETGNQQIHAFIYTNGVMHDLGTLGGSGSLANAINDTGQITGF